jgi:hypothetical protein
MYPKYFARGISVEMLKIKRSLVLLVALLVPLFPVCANVAAKLRTGTIVPEDNLGPWSLYLRYSIKLWAILIMPMLTALLSALLANVEHRTKQWKQLFVLPFPRSAIFVSKWVALGGITLLSTFVFAFANMAGGLAIHFLRPETGLDLPIPWGEALLKPLISWLLSMAMMAIHLWISLRWSSFLVSLTIGFTGTVSNIFLLSSYLYEKAAFSPWAMPGYSYDDWLPVLAASCVGALVILVLAGVQFVRRDA